MVRVHRPEFVPDPALDRAAMESLQREIAAAAVFEDDLDVDPALVGGPDRSLDSDFGDDADAEGDETTESPIVAGVDQAFRDDEALSAVVAIRDGEVIEEVHAVEPVKIPYVPGLLSFREGRSILSALEKLSVEPDVLLVDGSGRIHFREAGIATHVGVTCNVPAVGVAKSLLCGTPDREIPGEGFPPGERVPILGAGDVTAPDDEVIGYAVQTKQYASGRRHVNPVYVSPGHRVSAATAANLALATSDGYKLPEPIRLADQLAGELTSG